MVRFLSRIVLFLSFFLIITCGIAWLFLVSPFFNTQRSAFAERILFDQLGRPVRVLGYARLEFPGTSSLVIQDLIMPSLNSGDALAKLEMLKLDVDLFSLFQGRVRFNKVWAEGISAHLITSADRKRNWSKPSSHEDAWPRNPSDMTQDSNDQQRTSLVAKPMAFNGASIDLSDVELKFTNKVSGFEFLFDLKRLSLFEADANGNRDLLGTGAVNRQPFKIEGHYPSGESFKTRVEFGDTELDLMGESAAVNEGGGYFVKLASKTTEVGSFLEVLGLQRTVEGQGNLTAMIRLENGVLSVDRVDANLDTANAEQFVVAGSIEDLVKADGIDVVFSARFHPDGSPPPRASSLQDIELMRVVMNLTGSNEDLVLDSLLVFTNAFDQGFDRIGQAAIRKFRRTPEGKLEIRDVELRAEAQGAPYLMARGTVGNVLELSEYILTGDIRVPAGLVLKSISPEKAELFGSLNGSFVIESDAEALNRTHLTAKAVDSNYWDFDTEVSLQEREGSDWISAAISAGIGDPAGLLRAMGGKPTAGGALRLGLGIEGSENGFDAKIDASAGASSADFDLNVALEKGLPVIRGDFLSKRVSMSDVRQAMQFFLEFTKAAKAAAASHDGRSPLVPHDEREVQTRHPKDERTAQPLVLEDTRQAEPLILPDQREVQPLQLENERVAQPLVLHKGDAPSALKDFFSLDSIVSKTDLALGIKIDRIVGQPGVSTVQSDMTMNAGKLTFGPLNIKYGGGYFNLNASMDAITTPGAISVSGSTDGWDIGELLASLGADIGASGIMKGRFFVTGRNSSVNGFLRSMVGSAQVSMNNARLDTSLLELAGLGVLPWLFSKEMLAGSTRIVCLKVPFRIERGKLTSNQAVLETPDVQLVARGHVDIPGDTILVRAEPRPVGRPLARSAAPFNISGKLSSPQVDVQFGGARARRADGANTMPANRKPCTPDIYQLQ